MMTFSTKLMDLQFFNRETTHSRSIVSVHASVRYFDDDGEITQSMPLGDLSEGMPHKFVRAEMGPQLPQLFYIWVVEKFLGFHPYLGK